jgi:hypothetical protein
LDDEDVLRELEEFGAIPLLDELGFETELLDFLPAELLDTVMLELDLTSLLLELDAGLFALLETTVAELDSGLFALLEAIVAELDAGMFALLEATVAELDAGLTEPLDVIVSALDDEDTITLLDETSLELDVEVPELLDDICAVSVMLITIFFFTDLGGFLGSVEPSVTLTMNSYRLCLVLLGSFTRRTIAVL